MFEKDKVRNIIDYNLNIIKNGDTWTYDIIGEKFDIVISQFTDDEMNRINSLIYETSNIRKRAINDLIINISKISHNINCSNNTIFKDNLVEDGTQHMVIGCMMQEGVDPILTEPMILSLIEYAEFKKAIENEDAGHYLVIKLKDILKRRYVYSFYHNVEESVRVDKLFSDRINIRLTYYKNMDVDPKFYMYVEDTYIDDSDEMYDTYAVFDII